MQLTFWGDWLFGGGAEFPYVVEVSVPPVVVSIKGGARGGGGQLGQYRVGQYRV